MKSFRTIWKNLARQNLVSCNDVIVNCALRAFFAKSNADKAVIAEALLSQAFTPIKRQSKLDNGAKPYQAFEGSLTDLYFRYKFSTLCGFLGLDYENTVKEIFEGDASLCEEFTRFLVSLHKDKIKLKEPRYYTYIVVDQENVEPVYQAVQASHAAMVVGQQMGNEFDAHNIYFQLVKKPKDLNVSELSKLLTKDGFKVEAFYETDKDRIIALATHPKNEYKRGKLRDFELLTFEGVNNGNVDFGSGV